VSRLNPVSRPNAFGEALGLGLIAFFAPPLVRDLVPLAPGDPFAGTLQLLPFLLGTTLLGIAAAAAAFPISLFLVQRMRAIRLARRRRVQEA
jgi:hypothetical protein